jgi:IclR family transcriptional regulator, pca regulon regulatory protein
VKEPSKKVPTLTASRYSQSLELGVAILRAFSPERKLRGIADLADELGMSRSTTHRYVITLVALGFLEQDASRKYRLGPHVVDLGLTVLATITSRPGVRLVLEDLRDRTGHTASLGVLGGAWAIYVQRAHSHGRGQYQADGDLGPGTHLPLHCTALGKAMLASHPERQQRELIAEMTLTREGPNTITTKHALLQALARIKAAGFAISDEEHAAGVRSIAIIVNGRASRQTFAVEVTVPAARYTAAELTRHVGPSLREAARHIHAHRSGRQPQVE